MTTRFRVYTLIGLGGLLEAGFLSLIALGNLTVQAGQYIGVCGGLFGGFGLASWWVLRRGKVAGQTRPLSMPTRPALLVILFFAGLFRLTLLLAAPTLSTDQFRYTWEGRLVTQGVSPYRYAPDSPALAPYRSPIWPLVQQRDTTSPYPPLSQLIGAGEYLALADSLLGPKLSAVAFDLLNVGVLVWLLGLYGLDRRKVILYAWCPLPIIEFGQSGHNDAPMLLLLLLAIGLAWQRRPYFSALVLGLACLAKFTPLFVLPIFMASWVAAGPTESGSQWQQLGRAYLKGWRYPALTLGVIIAGYLPFLILGQGALGSILEYTGSWRDNEALVYGWVADFFGNFAAKAVSLLIFGVGLALLTLWPRLVYRLSLARRTGLGLGLTLLVASTIHTWYLSWILVLLPLVWGEDEFKWWDWAWVIFAAMAELPYLTYIYNGNTPLYQWIRPLEFWPLNVLIVWNLWQIWRKHRQSVVHREQTLAAGQSGG